MTEQSLSKSPAGRTPPGPRGLPLFGSLFSLRHSPHLAIHQIAKQYGDVCLVRLGNVPTVIISHPDLLREAFTSAELSDRWVGQIMGILSHHGNDLAMAPNGEQWRQLQRFANRELLSLRRLQQIREQHVVDVVNSLVETIGEKADAEQLIEPMDLLSRSNAMIMFRAIFGSNQNDTAGFEAKREELLEFVFWVFRNATSTNPADYVPWLKIIPNNTIRETEQQKAVRDNILNFLIDSIRARPDLDPENPTCLIEVMLAREQEGQIDRETILLLIADLLLPGLTPRPRPLDGFC